ncbi:MAG: radical SAM family heme chaperone HemW [Stappiaceae bacterium]
MNAPDNPGFGIYVHWPFCAAKCPYCDFNSHVRHHKIDQRRYLTAFKSELAYMAEKAKGGAVGSIFIGGGTPSLMAPQTVEGILEAIAQQWTVSEDVEITLEANPSSVEAGRFAGYRSAGVNRVSLGVQALNDKDLRRLGRLHDVDSAMRAIGIARDIFDRMSFDLIYARPDQTVNGWRDELAQALDYAADHLSLYQLTIERDTPFYDLHQAGKLIVPSQDEGADFYEVTQEICDLNGMPAYEISNHARKDAQCRHNLTYWRYGDYVGVGPGAHGRVEIDGHRYATATEKNPENWLEAVENNQHGITVLDRLNDEETGDEYLLMALRMVEGVDFLRYRDLSGRELDPDKIEELISYGLVSRIGNRRIRATRDGFFVLDAVVADLAA